MSTWQKASLVGSGIVVAAFFAPWAGPRIGLHVVVVSLQMLERHGRDWILVGVTNMLFILLPLVCHSLNLLGRARRRVRSLVLVSIPLAFWILVFVYASAGAGRSVLPASQEVMTSPGFMATLLGQLVAVKGGFMTQSATETGGSEIRTSPAREIDAGAPGRFRVPVTVFVIAAVVLIGSVIWNQVAQDAYREAFWSWGGAGEESAKLQVQVSRVLQYVGGAGAALGLILAILAAAGRRET